ncbi:MAG: M16 family metallopeptidase, partial [Planctomycetota bacterium]
MKRWLLCTLLAGCATQSTPPADPTEGITIVERQTESDGITEARLDNGLKILLQEKHDVPVVSSYIWYRVGSANEESGATGLAHYLEHLLFKGTDRYRKGEIDALTLKNGGANNAFTWRDYTAYYFNFASDRWDTALQIESNRMRHTVFDAKEFNSEKKVVLEELYRALDRPTGKLERDMRVQLYGAAHPYGHHTLGTKEDLEERVDVATVKAFYDKYYWPNNATMVIVGDFDTDTVLARIEELFGAIPAGESPPPLDQQRPAAPGNARIEMPDDVAVARAIIDHPGVTVGEPDDFVLDVISRILGGGVASRLYQRLVENDRSCVAASTWNASGNLPGSFTVEVQAQTGADRAVIDAAVAEELARLAAEPVSAEELDRAKTQIIAGFTFDKEKADERAYLIGLYDAHGDHTLMGRYT